MTTLADYLTLSVLLFSIGVYGLIRSRNAIRMLFAVEIIINAANLNLIAFSRFTADITGQVFTIFSIAIGAAEAAVGLAIIILVFRLTGDVDIAVLRRLKR